MFKKGLAFLLMLVMIFTLSAPTFENQAINPVSEVNDYAQTYAGTDQCVIETFLYVTPEVEKALIVTPEDEAFVQIWMAVVQNITEATRHVTAETDEAREEAFLAIIEFYLSSSLVKRNRALYQPTYTSCDIISPFAGDREWVDEYRVIRINENHNYAFPATYSYHRFSEVHDWVLLWEEALHIHGRFSIPWRANDLNCHLWYHVGLYSGWIWINRDKV